MDIPVNPGLLQEISKMTGGEYYRATDRNELKNGLQKVLNALERSKILEGGAMTNYRERFHEFLVWAFALACLELLLRATFLRIFP
jgi:Ca-activated chloride channel family protein